MSAGKFTRSSNPGFIFHELIDVIIKKFKETFQIHARIMLLQALLLPFLFVSNILADISISEPTLGSVYTSNNGKVILKVSWKESHLEPSLSEIDTYSFILCTGPNDDINGLKKLKTLDTEDLKETSVQVDVPVDIGADGKYFLQVYATVQDGGYTINYSQRFTLKGMTGSIIPAGDNPSPPMAEIHLGTTETMGLPIGDTSQSFLMYYTLQTGLTRYAPMQTQPGTKVTVKTWQRQFPTSSVTYYSSLKSTMEQISTVTLGWSYTLSSAVNHATPAPFPSQNGGWYNPMQKVMRPTLSRLTSMGTPSPEPYQVVS